MFRFILGTAQTGKTYTVINEIKKAAEKDDGEIFMLVPEQYSFEYEKELIRALGVKLSNRVNVVSFTKLCRALLRDNGGLKCKVADEGSRIILLTKALGETKDELVSFKGYTDSAFAKNLLKDINEIKQSGITPEMLTKAKNRLADTNKSLSNKVGDIATVLSAYNKIISEKFIDPQDITELAASRVNGKDKNWFDGKYLFVDGFTGFTNAQYSLIKSAIASAKESVFCFCTDGKEYNKEVFSDIFRNVKEEIAKIREIGRMTGSKEGETVFLEGSHSKSEDIKTVDRIIRGEKPDATKKATDIKVVECGNIGEEAEYIAEEIKRAVRENKDLKWRDFTVVAGTEAGYARPVFDALRLNGIPCFISRNEPLSNMPIVKFTNAVLDVVIGNFRLEDMIAYIKSGLTPLNEEDTDILETYSYVWNISGKKWNETWDMNPAGINLKGAEGEDEKSKEELIKINKVREKAINPLEALKSKRIDGGSVTAKEIVSAIFEMFDSIGISDKLKDYRDELIKDNEEQFASLQSASWDKLISVFDRIVNCIGDTKVTLAGFKGLFETAVSNETVGQIPARANEVVFGASGRIRLMRPKVVIVIGANHGVFPAGIINNGIFTLGERKKLENIDIKLPDRSIGSAIEQNYAFYDAVASATDKLIITYSKNISGGKPSLPTAAIINCFEGVLSKYSSAKSSPDRLESRAAAYRYLASRVISGDENFQTVKAALSGSEYQDKIDKLGKKTEFSNLPEALAKELYKKKVTVSASELEDFYGCPFSYFLKRGLYLNVIKPAKVDSQSRGTIAHEILEKTFKNYDGNDDFKALTDENVARENAEKYAKEYFNCRKIDTDMLDSASKYVLENVIESITLVIVFIATDFNTNKFKPVGYELGIGKGIGGIDFSVGDENITVKIKGEIDRVDVANEDGNTYIRVIDYKSYGKSFSLKSTLDGRNMQMLLYLCAILESDWQKESGKKLPAGVIYTNILPGADKSEDSSAGQDEENDDKPFKPKQSPFILQDEKVVNMMGGDKGKTFIDLDYTNKTSKNHKTVSKEDFDTVMDWVKHKTVDMVKSIKSGHIEVNPIGGAHGGCKYCDFAPICDMTEDQVKKTFEGKIDNEKAARIMRGEE